LHKEVHRGRNQLASAEIFVTSLEEEVTVTAKGDFAILHRDMFCKSLNGVEGTLKRISEEYGERETVPVGSRVDYL
jgi:hypothetical protein